MQTILTQLNPASYRSLALELADVDDRQLLDMGLVRGADGALYHAADPSQPVGPALPWRRTKAVLGALASTGRWLRSLPLRSPDWRPHFFLRE